MQRLTVPGGWVDVREPEDVPERLRRRVTTMSGQAASVAGRLSDDDTPEASDVEFVLGFNDAICMCLVMGWSWDFPVSSDGLLDLPGPAYDALVKHAQSQLGRLIPSFAVDPNPKVPTETSSE